MTTHHVSIGEIVTTTSDDAQLRMVGLGSCVGVFLIVPGKFGAAAHILLPERPHGEVAPTGKYADTAVPHLIGEAQRSGFDISQLEASVIGGAQVFKFSGKRPELEIGTRNAQAALSALSCFGISIAHEDTGGNQARTVTVPINTGEPS